MLTTVRDKTPQQMKFSFAYWTAVRVRQAIVDQFGVQASVWTVRCALKRMGLTPQKPKFRSHLRSIGDVQAWIEKTYPDLKAQARSEGAVILFVDEAGMRADYHVGRTWGVRGKTPVVVDTGQRFGWNMFAAITPDGQIHFRIQLKNSKAVSFIEFLQTIQAEQGQPIYVVADNCSIHTARAVKEFVAQSKGITDLSSHPLDLVGSDLNPQYVGSEFDLRIIVGLPSRSECQRCLGLMPRPESREFSTGFHCWRSCAAAEVRAAAELGCRRHTLGCLQHLPGQDLSIQAGCQASHLVRRV